MSVLLVLFSFFSAFAQTNNFCKLSEVNMSYSVLVGGVGYHATCGDKSVGYYRKAFCFSKECRKELVDEAVQDLNHQGLYFLVKVFHYDVFSDLRLTNQEKMSLRIIKREAYRTPKMKNYVEEVNFYKTSCFSNQCAQTVGMTNRDVDRADRKTVELISQQNNCEIIGSFVDVEHDNLLQEIFLCLI